MLWDLYGVSQLFYVWLWEFLTTHGTLILAVAMIVVVLWGTYELITVELWKRKQRSRGLPKMTRRERQRYLRVKIPDLVVAAFEAAEERGELTKTEVNQHYRILAGAYKMPDFKAMKKIGVACVVTPTKKEKPRPSHFAMVKAAINMRLSHPWWKLFQPVHIPGPRPGEPNGTPPPPAKRRGVLAGKQKFA